MKCTTRLTSIALALAGLALGANAIQAAIIDDFSGTLAPYTATVILDANGGGSNAFQWEIAGGSLQINTATYEGIEQTALTRTDVPLAVGQELRVDYLGGNNGSQDIGLYVGAGTPTTGVRADYVNVYARNNGQVFSRGFNGSSEFGLSGGATPANLEYLYINRTAIDMFEAGYSAGGVRTALTTRTVTNTNIGNAIGLYSDVRAAGIRGNVDNLRVVPEPASLALAGLTAVGLLVARRRAA